MIEQGEQPQISTDNVVTGELMKPWQLPWQRMPWQLLCRSFKQQNLAHAFVVEGGEGHATTDFVTVFTQLLHCQQLTSESEYPHSQQPCQRCHCCRQIAGSVYPDFKIVELIEGKKQISVDQVRELTNFFQQSAHGQGFRVLLIKDAELMTHAAMNAILKTLEEPGNNSLLFLQTNHPLSLTATIRSRCLKLSFIQVNDDEVISWLNSFNDNHLATDQLRQLLLMSDNHPIKALSLLQTNALETRSEIIDKFYACLSSECTIDQFLSTSKEADINQLWAWIGQEIMNKGNTAIRNSNFRISLSTLYFSLQKQLFASNHVDKWTLLREFLIKSIANSAILSHS